MLRPNGQGFSLCGGQSVGKVDSVCWYKDLENSIGSRWTCRAGKVIRTQSEKLASWLAG